MDSSYFTRRLLDTLTLAEQTADTAKRSVYLRACHYYKDLLCQGEAGAAERLTVPARLVFDNGGEDHSVVADLSCCGFVVEDRPGLGSGGRFTVVFPGLTPLPALVIQRDSGWAECNFTAPLHPALLEAAMAVSRSSGSGLYWPSH